MYFRYYYVTLCIHSLHTVFLETAGSAALMVISTCC